MPVNLDAMIAEVKAGRDDPDRTEITELVLERLIEAMAGLPRDELRELLRPLVRSQVRVDSARQRKVVPAAREILRNARRSETMTALAASHKAETRRNMIERWRAFGEIHVPSPDGGAPQNKWIADLTADECQRVSDAYAKLAKANQSHAVAYGLLAQSLKAERAETVRDLGLDYVMTILGVVV